MGRNQDTEWHHWKQFPTASGHKLMVECLHCGNKQLKNATKCREHITKCLKRSQEVKHEVKDANKPSEPSPQNFWLEWKHVSGSGVRSVVECLHCGNRRLKNVTKCRQHIVKCLQKAQEVDKIVKSSDAEPVAANQPVDPPPVLDNGMVYIWRHWKHVSGSVVRSLVECLQCGNRMVKNATKCQQHIAKCLKGSQEVKQAVEDGCDADGVNANKPSDPLPDNNWLLWKDVSSGVQSVVQCLYCGNKQMKNATKCRKHTSKCLLTLNVRHKLAAKRLITNDECVNRGEGPPVPQYRPRVFKSLDIHDLLDELSDENKRLLDELKFAQKYIEFMQNYRKCVLVYKRKCVCVQTIDNKPIVQRLETSYEDIKTQIQRMRTQSVDDYRNSEEESVAKRKQNKALIAFNNTFKRNVNLANSQMVTTDDDRSSVGGDFGDDYNPSDDSYHDFEPQIKKKSVSREHTNEESFKCQVCDRIYTDRHYFREHLAIHAVKQETTLDGDNQSNPSVKLIDYRRVDGRIVCQWRDCDMTFPKPFQMWQHYRRKHTTIRPYKCPHCPKAVAFRKDLKQHSNFCTKSSDRGEADRRLADDTADDSHECYIFDCQRVFADKPSLARHTCEDHKYSSTNNKSFACDWPECGLAFRQYRALRIHQNRDHMNTMSYVCRQCGATFPTDLNLRAHQKRCVELRLKNRKRKAVVEDTDDDHDLPSAAQKRRTAGELVLCCQYPDCGHECDTQSQLRNHIDDSHCPLLKPKPQAITHYKYGCEWTGCERRFRRVGELQGHYRTDHNCKKPFKCHKCDKHFHKRHALLRHKSVYHWGTHPKINYRCAYEGCDGVFDDRHRLVAHTRKVHTKETPYACEQCDRRFAMKYDLTKHVTRIHSQAYACEACGHAFDSTTDRKEHYRENMDHLLYPCDQCAKRFGARPDLDHHRRKCHPTDRECLVPDCDRRFADWKSLRAHALTHGTDWPLICEWPGCERPFVSTNEVTQHRKTHTAIDDHRCPQCGKTLRSKRTYDKHMDNHRAVRKYSCCWPGCDQSFTNRYQMDAHVYQHQGLKPYRCHLDGCQYAYYSPTMLRRHYKDKHNTYQLIKNMTAEYPTKQFVITNSANKYYD